MFKKLSVMVGVLMVFALTSTSATSARALFADLTLASGGTSTYTIRVCADPTLAEVHAADELQQFLEEISGATLPIQQAGTLPKYAILVGRDAECDRLVPEVNWDVLGGEGLVVATVGSRLILAGGRPRGTLYAVYSFLQEELGCRWFAPDASLIPPKDPLVISSINRTFVPTLEYREIGGEVNRDLNWATRNFLNGQNVYRGTPSPETLGGRVIYAGYFVHTFYLLLPPGDYFAAHPDWYSANSEGTRYYAGGQLCLTNPEVVTAVTGKVREWLLANSSATIVSVSQNDGPGDCQCDTCLARNAKLGGPSGTLIEFVNKIARNVKDEFPDVAVDTLAYDYTFPPPTVVDSRNVPDENVIVRVCVRPPWGSYLCKTDAARNNFRVGLTGWKAICQRIYVWDYVSNLISDLVPMPDLETIGPNIKYYAENNVKGIFSETTYGGVGTESAELRSYLIARSLWKPELSDKTNSDSARDEFLNFYYGPAAQPIRAYLQELELSRSNTATGSENYYWWCQPNAAYLTRPTLSTAWELFDEAEQLAIGQPEIRKRVRTARLPLQYVVLCQGPGGWGGAYNSPGWDEQGVGFYRTRTGESPVPWVNKELVEQFLAAAAEAHFSILGLYDTPTWKYMTWVPFRDALIARYGIKNILFSEIPTGMPNPVILGGTVQCMAQAQYIINPASVVTYTWSAPEGRFEDTGTTTSALQNPRWIADVTIPGGDYSKSVQIQVTDSCGSETPITTAYFQQVFLSPTTHTLTAPAAVNVTVWNTADINASGGSASENSGVFTVVGKGAGITGTADSFRFVCWEVSGDCTITARITAVTGTTYTEGRSGVMIRQDTISGAKEASSLYRPYSTKRYYFHKRTTTGSSTSTSYESANTNTPWWVRMVRTGNTLKAYKSTNGTTWTQVGSNTTVTMTNPVKVGLIVTSGNTSNANTVTFNNVTITQP